MKKLFVLAVGLLLLGTVAFATDWGDTAGHGMFPYWQTGTGWYTLLIFVNGSEETPDVIHVRFFDMHGNPCSSTMADMFSIRQGEQLMFSTTGAVPTFIPVTAGYGYVLFRTDTGGYIQGYCVIYNGTTGTGYVVSCRDQKAGF
ncbi:MAG TPA: hypothetical protein VM163_14250 [bacterium]|nr:hypothetical protein [bacterium]